MYRNLTDDLDKMKLFNYIENAIERLSKFESSDTAPHHPSRNKEKQVSTRSNIFIPANLHSVYKKETKLNHAQLSFISPSIDKV